MGLLFAMVAFSLIISNFKNTKFDTNQNLYESSVSINSRDDSTNSSKLLGSGVIISKDGLILTNYHVAYSAPSLSVKFNNESLEQSATIVKLDKYNDLALIRVDKNFPKKKVANFESFNNIFKGQDVFAIGTPLNKKFFNSITHGIVSNKNVAIQMKYNDGTNTSVFVKNLTMLDFKTNGGNSGGPLFNSNGNLIGIMSSTNHEQGVSLAIAIEQINTFLKDVNAPNK
jgi:S1-C subfamily serine protease